MWRCTSPALMMCTDAGLVRYETFYKMLDLYYQFFDETGGKKYRRRPAGAGAGKRTEETIMRYLAKNKKGLYRKMSLLRRAAAGWKHIYGV